MSRVQRRDDMFQQDLALERRVDALESAQRASREWTRITTSAAQPVSLVAGWDHWDLATYGPAEYRIIDDEVQLRGAVKLSNSTVPANASTPILIGTGYRPTRNATFSFINSITAAGFLYVVASTGLLTLSGAASTNFISLNPVRFSLMPTTTG